MHCIVYAGPKGVCDDYELGDEGLGPEGAVDEFFRCGDIPHLHSICVGSNRACDHSEWKKVIWWECSMGRW
jgi:hypothetical protein